AVYPGATLLTVIPSLPNSMARLFTNPTTAGLTALERIRSGIGWRTDVDVIVTSLPQRFRCICGITERAKATTLRKLRSTALRHSSIVMERKFFGGGPPAFATQISIRPNFFATALTNFETASASVTSTGWAKT